jgi:phosphate transport system substrate-binding protein
MEACRAAGIKYLELPVAFDALTVVVNPQNTWVKQLTVADLKKMWEPGAQGRVKTWNQIRSEWPNQPLMLFGPGADSGTFDYFTEAVNGKAKASRGDYTASEDDNVLVQGVENNKNALGYFGFAYYVGHKDKMKAVPSSIRRTAGRPEHRRRERWLVQPLSRPAVHLRARHSRAAPEVKEFIAVLPRRGRRPGEGSRLCAAAAAGVQAGAAALQRRQAGHRVRRHPGSRRHYRRAPGSRRQALSVGSKATCRQRPARSPFWPGRLVAGGSFH